MANTNDLCLPTQRNHYGRMALAVLTAAVLLSGCSSDRGTFVTFTGAGFNTHPTNPAFSVAFDRFEGFLGPVQENGKMPSVYSWIDSQGGLFDRNVSQVYATGIPAICMADRFGGDTADSKCQDPAACQPNCSTETKDSGKSPKRLGFFATRSVYGLMVGFNLVGTNATPLDFTVGIRRQEISNLPNQGDSDKYPDTIAAFTVGANAKNGNGQSTNAEDRTLQLFAAGAAARSLARNTAFLTAVQDKVDPSLKELFGKEASEQKKSAAGVVRCFAMLDSTSKTAWIDESIKRNILTASSARNITRLTIEGKAANQNAGPDNDGSDQATQAQVDPDYSQLIEFEFVNGVSVEEGFDYGRSVAIRDFEKRICNAADTSLRKAKQNISG